MVIHQSRHLNHSQGAAVPRQELLNEIQAPFLPRPFSITTDVNETTVTNLAVINVYPNPATEYVEVAFVVNESDNVIVEMRSMTGQIVESNNLGTRSGLCKATLSVEMLPAGIYFIDIITAETRQTVKILVD
jgi:hypothetical protein